MLVRGEIAFTVGRQNPALLNGVSIENRARGRIEALGIGDWDESYSLEEALEIMNMNGKNHSILRDLLGSKRSEGSRIEGPAIADLASEWISKEELSARTGLAETTLRQRLEKAGHVVILPGLYRRTEVVRAYPKLLC